MQERRVHGVCVCVFSVKRWRGRLRAMCRHDPTLSPFALKKKQAMRVGRIVFLTRTPENGPHTPRRPAIIQ